MDYGYSRCSTNETKQDINRQVRELKAAGAVEIFMEYEHRDAMVKSQQAQMFAQAQAGDTIIVLEVSRLATLPCILQTKKLFFLCVKFFLRNHAIV